MRFEGIEVYPYWPGALPCNIRSEAAIRWSHPSENSSICILEVACIRRSLTQQRTRTQWLLSLKTRFVIPRDLQWIVWEIYESVCTASRLKVHPPRQREKRVRLPEKAHTRKCKMNWIHSTDYGSIFESGRECVTRCVTSAVTIG